MWTYIYLFVWMKHIASLPSPSHSAHAYIYICKAEVYNIRELDIIQTDGIADTVTVSTWIKSTTWKKLLPFPFPVVVEVVFFILNQEQKCTSKEKEVSVETMRSSGWQTWMYRSIRLRNHPALEGRSRAARNWQYNAWSPPLPPPLVAIAIRRRAFWGESSDFYAAGMR